ncbi:hypothetical protein HY570_03130 [Candidatus Micrarchaeota archaeon]|nr:hypothetical protein [Candidatus Micrarchaeota archaeon]
MENSFGQVKDTIPLYKDSMSGDLGEIVVYESGLLINIGTKLAIPFSYVADISERKKLPLGKVLATMDVFDMLGNRNSYEFVINELNLQTLRRVCKK